MNVFECNRLVELLYYIVKQKKFTHPINHKKFIVYYCIEATITRMNIKFIVMQVGISKQIVTIEQYIYIKLTISIFYIKRKKKHKKNSNFVYLLKKKNN